MRSRLGLLKNQTHQKKKHGYQKNPTKNVFFGGGPPCSDVVLLFDITPAHAGAGVMVGRCGGGRVVVGVVGSYDPINMRRTTA